MPHTIEGKLPQEMAFLNITQIECDSMYVHIVQGIDPD